jgi:hypothetical protein
MACDVTANDNIKRLLQSSWAEFGSVENPRELRGPHQAHADARFFPKPSGMRSSKRT